MRVNTHFFTPRCRQQNKLSPADQTRAAGGPDRFLWWSIAQNLAAPSESIGWKGGYSSRISPLTSVKRSAMESLVNVITSLPPEAVDRQRLLECLGNAEKNRIGGRMREASKWIMQVGATLHKKGGPAMPLAERVFQHAVHLAKQLDGENPQEFLLVEQEGNNPELGDAYTWLGATEAALGKTAEAETHYKAAAKAIEERGVVDLGDKLLHQCIFFRNRDNREKYEATIRRWENAIRDAHKAGDEGDVALLTSTIGCLLEKAIGIAKNPGDGLRMSARLRGGPIARCALRLEAHPLRPAKSSPSVGDVYELTAQTYDKAGDKKLCIAYLGRCAAATACSLGFAGLTPLGECLRDEHGDEGVAWTSDLLDFGKKKKETKESTSKETKESTNKDTKQKKSEIDEIVDAIEGETSDADAGKTNGKKGGAATLYDDEDRKDVDEAAVDDEGMPKREGAALQVLFSIGDGWKMRGGMPGKPEVMEGAEDVGTKLYVLGQQLFAAEAWRESQRPLRASAALIMHMPFQQGAACHYLACAYFHENMRDHGGKEERLRAYAAGAFQAAAAARLSLGPDEPKAVKEAVGSLLFLGRVLVDMNNWRDAERIHVQALEIARQSLGDEATETKNCLQAMMNLRGKMRHVKEALDNK